MKTVHCRAPFVGLTLTPTSEYCCCCCDESYTNNITQHRLDMYKNNINELCKTCSIRYEFDAKEYDNIFNHNIKNFDINTGLIRDFKIGWLHLVYTYFCNSDCVMCGLEKNNNKTLNLNSIPTQNISKISLQGGEIFLFEKSILELLNLINPQYLNIITNGTIISNKIYQKMSNFKNTCITFSIDGIGDMNEAIRINCKYEKIINNIKSVYKNYTNLTIIINYTVTIFNIYNILDDLIQLKNDLKNINFTLCLNLCYQPKYFSVCSLDEFNKQEIKKLIDVNTIVQYNLLNNLKKRTIVTNIYKNPHMFDELIKLINYTPIKQNISNRFKREMKKRPLLYDKIHKNIRDFIESYNIFRTRD